MKLEEEIKQSKFRNEYHKLAVNIMYSYGWLMNLQAKLFVKYDITGNQYNILRILRGQYPNPANVNLLKERMVDKMSDASRLVERLRVKKYVQRESCPNDRRRVNVSITQKGLDVLAEIDKLNDRYDAFFKNLSIEESKVINDLLDTMRG